MQLFQPHFHPSTVFDIFQLRIDINRQLHFSVKHSSHLTLEIMADGWGTTASASGWGNETTTDAPANDDAWAGGGDGNNDGGGEDAGDAKPVPPPLPFERRDAPIAKWEETQAYDYEALATGTTGDWAGNEQVYHWDGEVGDIGPESKALEQILFGNEEERDTDFDFDK